MSTITRREFLKLGGKLAVMMGMGATAIPQIADALEDLVNKRARVIWLQAQACSGCSISFINAEHPGPAELMTRYISLLYHSTLSTATGHVGMEVLNKSIDQGDYLLVTEGSIPALMPKACVVGGETITDQVARAAKKAKAIITIGNCATFGGIPSAENNQTGAISVPDFLKTKGLSTPIVSIPGCPAHPDWFVGSLVHVLKFGIPPLDRKNRPKMFFSKTNHETCPRFSDYERENFASTFSDDGCLFKLGCMGPSTYADCSLRNWNGGINSCIRSGSPCIGCASEMFAKKAAFPFYRKGEKNLKEGRT